MTARCPLFVELCCGSAAVTLRLIGGPNARPPISYMGAKTGYAAAILHALGLRSGQGADACVLVEAGPWTKAWRLLTTPEGCRAVAAVIRGWVGEDARALWDRLRAEPVPAGDAEAVGAWLYLHQGSWHQKGPDAGIGRPEGAPDRGTFGGERPVADVVTDSAAALAALRWPPVQVVEGDVAVVEPRDVARWLYLTQRSAFNKGAEAGYKPEERDCSEWAAGSHAGRWDNPRPVMADACAALPPWPPTVISNADVATVEPGTLPPGTVVYFDPPYSGTTGYKHDLTRDQVLAIARRWSDAGATVCVSEAEPLPLDGWHHVEITGARVGQKRTFARVRTEWLTMNRAPVTRPMAQGSVFDLAEVAP